MLIDLLRHIIGRLIYMFTTRVGTHQKRVSSLEIYTNIIQNYKSLQIETHQKNVDSQYYKGKETTTDYKMDAIRFAYKIFAKTHLMLDCDYDYVFWVDADITFKKTITEKEVIRKFLPEGCAVSFIDRPSYYSECGFVGYNLKEPITKSFIYNLRRYYTKDLLFKEREWHDSYVWDCVRKKYLHGIRTHNLAPIIKKVGNPWPDTYMAEYCDHLKGKRRKDAGVMLR